MTSEDMLPIKSLMPCMASEAPVGSLLLPVGTENEVVQLRFDGSHKLAVRLDPSHPRAFTGINVESRHIPALALQNWSLRVDPGSSYSAFDATPAIGEVFISDNGKKVGLIILLDHYTQYITVNGDIIPEPNFGQDQFIGFRSWAIGRQVGERFIELLAVDRRAGSGT